MLLLGLSGIIFMSIGIIWRKRSLHITGLEWKLCSVLRFAEIGLFLLEKLIFIWYCFRSRFRAEQEAADLVVFDLHIHRLWYLMPIPLLLLLTHFTELEQCMMVSNSYLNPPFLFGVQSSFELVLAKIYLRWHQNHLKAQEGCI